MEHLLSFMWKVSLTLLSPGGITENSSIIESISFTLSVLSEGCCCGYWAIIMC